MKYNYDDENSKRLKKNGIILVIIGGILFIYGVAEIFFTYNYYLDSNQHYIHLPVISWEIALGVILILVGLVCIGFSYSSQVNHYTSTKITPIVKEKAKTFIDETKHEFSSFMNQIKQYAPNMNNQQKQEQEEKVRYCHGCGEKLSKDAVVCSYCGRKTTKVCDRCHHKNDSGARFCEKCGRNF